jgi:uncharacterized membrane protein YgcG
MIKSGGQLFTDLQNAIDTAAQDGGGTVMLGAEKMTVSSTIRLYGGVSLEGAGPGCTVLEGSEANPVLRVDGASDDSGYGISELTITGSSSSPGIDVTGPVTVNVHHVIIRDLTGDAINVGSAPGDVTLRNLTLLNNAGDGVETATGSVAFRNNLYQSNGGFAINNTTGSPVAPSYLNAASNNGTTGPQFNPLQQFNNVNLPVTYLGKKIEFRDASSNDYRVAAGSPVIDQGDPDDSWNKEPGSNGARINIGAYGNTMWATESDLEMGGPQAKLRTISGTTALAGTGTSGNMNLTASSGENSISLSWRVPFHTQNLSRDKGKFSAEIKYRGINVDAWNTVNVSSDAFTLPQDDNNPNVYFMDGATTIEDLSPGRTFEIVLYIFHEDSVVDPISLTSSTSGGSSTDGGSGSSGSGGGGGGGTAGPVLLLLVMSALGTRFLFDS